MEVRNMHSPKKQINYKGISRRARTVKSLLLFYLLLNTMVQVHGELVLTNFSSAGKLIKVMAIGDSITDDCEVNGAWRSFLQPLLEGDGYPFVFVGRQESSFFSGFTKTHHEGYCGAVIAAPGVLTSPVHGYTGTNV